MKLIIIFIINCLIQLSFSTCPVRILNTIIPTTQAGSAGSTSSGAQTINFPNPSDLPEGATMVRSFMLYKGGPTLPISLKPGNFDNSTLYNKDFFDEILSTKDQTDMLNNKIFTNVTDKIANNIVTMYRDQANLIGHTNTDILHFGLLVVAAAKPNVVSAEKVKNKVADILGETLPLAIDNSIRFSWSAYARNVFFPQEKQSVVGILDTEEYYLFNFGFGVMRGQKYVNWSKYTSTKIELLNVLKEDFSDVIDHWVKVFSERKNTKFFYRNPSDLLVYTYDLTKETLYNNFSILSELTEQFLYDHYVGKTSRLNDFIPPKGVDRIKQLRSFLLYDIANYSMIHSALMSNPFIIFATDITNYTIDPTVPINPIYNFTKLPNDFPKMFTFSVTDINIASFYKFYNYDVSFSLGRSYKSLPQITFGSSFNFDLYKYFDRQKGYDVYYMAERTDFKTVSKVLQTNTAFALKIQEVAFNPPFTNPEKQYYCGNIPDKEFL